VGTISIIILVVYIVGFLLLFSYLDEIATFIENKLLNKATRYAREVQALLFTLLGVVLTEMWRAVATLDWVKIVIYGLFIFIIIVAIWDMRQRSEDRRRLLDSQFARNLTASIKDAVKQALKEDRREEVKKSKKRKKEV
jgi:hypothetical protein